MVVLTEVFTNLARTAGMAQGYPELRTLVLPHPMESRPDSEIRRIATDRLPEVVALLAGPRVA